MKTVSFPRRLAVSILGVGLLAGVLAWTPARAASLEEIEAIEDAIYRYGLGEAAAGFDQGMPDADPTLSIRRLAKAEPDECFHGIFAGSDNATQWYDPDHTDAPAAANVFEPVPGEDCTPNKVNQAYVWGLTLADDTLWFGTSANVNCWVASLYLGALGAGLNGNAAWVCENRYSQFLDAILDQVGLAIPEPMLAMVGLLGDWRPPRIFSYDTATGELTERGRDLGVQADQDLRTILGIRSAGSLGDVVFLGGPGLDLTAVDPAKMLTVKLFAFNARTGAFLGSHAFPGLPGDPDTAVYNIRKWRVIDGVLYTTVGTVKDGLYDGRVLRWTGDAQEPFQFEVVGVIDTQGANLAEHDGRLFVSTWGGEGEFAAGDAKAGVWMSPPLPPGGLTPADAAMENWTKVWSAEDYEPDPTIARTYGCGALASFDGYLYWGTMHVPGLSIAKSLQNLQARLRQYAPFVTADLGDGPITDPVQRQAALPILRTQIQGATHRAIAVFRGRDFGTPEQRIDLLYGEPVLPMLIVDEEADDTYAVLRVDLVPNTRGLQPLYGPSGFGNYYNNYTWTMVVFQERLWVGTMNSGYLGLGDADRLAYSSLFPQKPVKYLDDLGIPNPDTGGNGTALTWREDFRPVTSVGAHLYRFEDAASPALPESTQGVGNYANYGIRTMVAAPDALYLGMANPMNLLTDNMTTDNGPHFTEDGGGDTVFDYWEFNRGTNIGGWELIRLSDRIPGLDGREPITVGPLSVAGATVWDFTVMAPDDPAVDQTNRPADMVFTDGLFSFTVKDLPVTPDGQAGTTVTVTLGLPDSYGPGARYYKVTANGFEEFVDDVTGEPLYAFAGNTVTLTLTDGGPWDADGVKNGEIVDPGGPAGLPAQIGGDDGRCFIATLFGSLFSNGR